MKRENAKLKSAGEELEAQLLNYRFKFLTLTTSFDVHDNFEVNNAIVQF